MKKYKKYTIAVAFVVSMMMSLLVVFQSPTKVEAATAVTNPATAPADWAFDASSVPLHDAILAKYPAVDTNSDGYISIGEAGNWTGVYEAGGYSGMLTINNPTPKLTGTINGIEYFTKIQHLALMNNQLSGSIPYNIGNMTSLQSLRLSSNQFTGAIPVSVGNLVNLTQLDLNDNQLTGKVPDSIGGLANLDALRISNNVGLSGNLVEMFKNHTKLLVLWIYNTGIIQACPNIPTISYSTGNFVFTDLAANLLLSDKTDTVVGLTQANIDTAQESADWIMDPIEKQKWQSNIDTAQDILDAKAGVRNLYPDDTFTRIKINLVQTDIDTAQNLVNAMPVGSARNDLQAKINKAKVQFNAQEAVDGLYTDITQNSIVGNLTQADITNAQNLVNQIVEPSSGLKGILQIRIDDAQKQLDARNKVNALYTDGTFTSIIKGLTQADINDAQTLVNSIAIGPERATLQTKLDEAKRQLNARTQVDSLYTDDTFASISSDVTQGGIDTVQGLVNAIKNGTEKTDLQAKIDEAQRQLDARNKVNSLYTDDTYTSITEDLTQADIDDAQGLVNQIVDGTEKTDLQAKIDEAQRQLDARNKVNGLYTDDTFTSITEDLTQADIDDAQALVNQIKDGAERTDLQAKIDEAQRQLDARNKVNSLYTDDTFTSITDDLTQTDIDDAQALVNQIKDGTEKADLQAKIDEAQRQLDARNKVNDMYTDDTFTSITDDLTQTDIDDAQALVDQIKDGAERTDLQAKIDEAQRQLDARNKVNSLYTDDTFTSITDDLTQTDINDAQALVNQIKDGTEKADLQAKIDEAQRQLDARNKVNGLYTDDTYTSITEDLTQTDIDDAQALVDQIKDGTEKADLQAKIDEAQRQLDARNKVNDLYTDDTNITEDLTQTDIDEAQDLVNKIKDGKEKEDLQAKIDEAQRQLDARNATSKPSIAPPTANVVGGSDIRKPSIAGASTDSVKNVNTNDTTNIVGLLVMLLMSSFVLGGLLRKKKQES